MSERLVQEFESRRPALWLPTGPLAWRTRSREYRAEVVIEGSDEPGLGRLVVSVGAQPWPTGKLSLLWRELRLRGVDLDGPPHRDPRAGAVPTPHQQWYDADGRQHTAPLDLEGEKLATLEHVLGWFLQWCGLPPGPSWTNPPAQPPLPGLGAPRGPGRP